MLPCSRFWSCWEFLDVSLRGRGMHLWAVFFAVSFVVLCNEIRYGPLAAEQDLREQIARLVAALDAPQRSVRDSAEKELEALGWRILPELSEVVPSSPEVAQRLARIRERLITQRVHQEAMESRVTLQVEQTSLEAILSAIQSQTGNTVIARGELARERISVSYHDAPFWKVIDGLAEQTRAEVTLESDGGVELLRNENSGKFFTQRQVTYAGPVRITVEKASNEQQNQTLALRSAERMVLNVTLAWEPRLRPAMLWWGPVELVTASEVHHVLLPSRREIPIMGPRCGVETAVVVDGELGKGQGVTIRGAFELVLPVCSETFRFARPGEKAIPARKRVGDVTVTLTSWSDKPGMVAVGLRAQYGEPHDAFASHRGWFYRWQAEIEGNGYRKTFDRLEALWLGDDGVELVYRFSGLPGPATAVRWTVPLAIVKIPAEFDIALEKLIQ